MSVTGFVPERLSGSLEAGEMADRLTRKLFLRRAGGLALVAAIPAACGGNGGIVGGTTSTTATTAATTSTQPGSGELLAYRLSIESGGCTGGRCSCKACVSHAANKLFSSREAAEENRAHPGCDCAVTEQALSRERWTALFDKGDVVDRRNPDVAKILA